MLALCCINILILNHHSCFMYGDSIGMLLFFQTFPEVVGIPRGNAGGDRSLGGGRRRRTGGVGEELIIVTHLGSTETPFTHVNNFGSVSR